MLIPRVTRATDWLTSGASKTTSSVDVFAGELLVVLAGTADNPTTLAISNSGTALTWTQSQATNTASNCKAYAWTHSVVSDRTALTVTLTRGGTGTAFFGAELLVFPPGSTLGGTNSGLSSGGGVQPGISVTTVGAGSWVGWAGFDWDATDGSTRASKTNLVESSRSVTALASTDTWTCIAHGYRAGDEVSFPTLTGGAGAATNTLYRVISTGLTTDAFRVASLAGVNLDLTTDVTSGTVTRVFAEESYSRDAAQYTAVIGWHGDSGSAGAKAVGLSTPTGGTWAVVAVEVQAPTGTTTTASVADGVGDIVAPTMSAGSSETAVPIDGVGDLIAPTVSGSSSGTVTSPVVDGAGDLQAPVTTVSAGTDTFNYADGDLSAPWMPWATSMPTIAGGKATATSGFSDATYAVASDSADSFFEAILDADATDGSTYVAGTRLTEHSGSADGYALSISTLGTDTTALVNRLDGNVLLDTSDAYQNVDGLRITVVDDLIKGYLRVDGDWVVVVSAVDPDPLLTAGYGGFGLAPSGGALVDEVSWGVASSTWEDIDGATLSSYDLVSDDVGALIRCVVRATNGAGFAEQESNELGPVDEGSDATVTVPTVDGVGDIVAPTASGSSAGTVTAVPADATGDVVAPSVSGTASATVTSPTADGAGDIVTPGIIGSEWTDISGATSSSYVLDSGDGDALIRCVVTATNGAGFASKESNELGPVDGSADAIVTAVPVDGVGDIATPSASGGGNATVTAVPADAAGALPPLSSLLSAAVLTGPTSGTGGIVVPTVGATASNTVTSPAADSTGDVPTPTVSAGAGVTAPVADGAGDVAAPAVSGSVAGQVVATPADGTGDVAPPSVTASATVQAARADGVADMLSPVVTSGGRILPRIDLPTVVILYNPSPVVVIANPTSVMTLDPALDDVVLDPQIVEVVLDG